MGGFIKRDVKRVETTALNQKVNKEVFDAFKDICKEQGYAMNVVLETFMQQYANGRFYIKEEDILKYKGSDADVDTLNTTFSKDIYMNFKCACKSNGYFVKHVVTAFMERYASRDLIMEFVDATETKEE